MAVKYIVTQLESPRHIVTRGFGAFAPLVDLGQAEIIELGNAHVNTEISFATELVLQKDFTARVTDNLEEIVYVAQSKWLITKVFVEPSVLVER